MDFVKTQIPTRIICGALPAFTLVLFGDNRGFVLFGAITSVVALFYFAGEKYG